MWSFKKFILDADGFGYTEGLMLALSILAVLKIYDAGG